jgi:hypothetical protein
VSLLPKSHSERPFFVWHRACTIASRLFDRKQFKRVEESMSIQKKSLISTLKTAKKANVASDAKGEKIASMRLSARAIGTAKMSAKSAKSLKSAKTTNLRMAQ